VTRVKLFPLLVVAIVFLTESGSRWFVLEGAVIWVGIEMIHGLTIGTDGFIGYAFYPALALIQPIGVFGIYGLSLLAMLIGCTLALLTIALYDRFIADGSTPSTDRVPVSNPIGSGTPLPFTFVAAHGVNGLRY